MSEVPETNDAAHDPVIGNRQSQVVNPIDPDAELVADLAAGRPEGFERLFRRFWPMVFRLATGWFANVAEAEDSALQAFVDVHRGIKSFRGRSRLSTWVYRVALNRVMHDRRSAMKHDVLCPLDSAPDVASPDPTPEERHDQLARCERIAGLIRSLPPQESAAVSLVLLSGLEPAEATEALKVRPATFRKRLSRGLARLRAMLNESETDRRRASEDGSQSAESRTGPAADKSSEVMRE
jgi:RNA polymerase sigma-70 factor (ECF subfamily)